MLGTLGPKAQTNTATITLSFCLHRLRFPYSPGQVSIHVHVCMVGSEYYSILRVTLTLTVELLSWPYSVLMY